MDEDIIDLTEKQLNAENISRSVILPNCGAVSMFIGTTRDNFDGKVVLKLEYEAYESMAKKKMKEICKMIRSKWKLGRIAIIHRLGEVPVTEASVVIAISSTHRKEALEAVSETIDALKANVPIWKKEIYQNHESAWKANKECAWSKETIKKDILQKQNEILS